MKTWHWIAIGAVVLIGAWWLFARQGSTVGMSDVGAKVGSGVADAGAPALPNVTLADPNLKITFNTPRSTTGLAGLGTGLTARTVPLTQATQTLKSSGQFGKIFGGIS